MVSSFHQKFAAGLGAMAVAFGATGGAKAATSPQAPTNGDAAYSQRLESCMVSAVRANAPAGSQVLLKNEDDVKAAIAGTNLDQVNTGKSLYSELRSNGEVQITASNDGPPNVDTTMTNSKAVIYIPNAADLSKAELLGTSGVGGAHPSAADQAATTKMAVDTLKQVRACMNPAP